MRGRVIQGNTIAEAMNLPCVPTFMEWKDTFTTTTLEMARQKRDNMTLEVAQRLHDNCFLNFMTFDLGMWPSIAFLHLLVALFTSHFYFMLPLNDHITFILQAHRGWSPLVPSWPQTLLGATAPLATNALSHPTLGAWATG